MKTSEAGTSPVVTTVEDATLPEVARLMRDHHVGCVVVLDAGGARKPIGILTDRDIVVEAVAASVNPATLTAGEVMTREPVTLREGDDAGWALKVMRDRGVRRLPVVDSDGRLKGLIALDDLLSQSATTMMDVAQAIGTGRLVESFRRTPQR